MTRVCRLTPAGRGAIAVVEVTGADAVRLVDSWFGGAHPLTTAPINAIRFGSWRRPHADTPGEELVAVRTATDRVEVHCHGGVAAAAAIVASLVSDGAVETKPSPASLADELQDALANAPTERVAGVLLDQVNGSLDAALRSLISLLDAGDATQAGALIDDLLSRERLGRRLTQPWRIVIAGAPNVGKSSLVNALVGFDRAIVYDLPGTTRDVVTATTAVSGWPVTLADTAGVRATDNVIEAAGVELARATLRSADIVVVVREAAAFASPEALELRDSLLAEATVNAAVIEVASKADLNPRSDSIPSEVIATDAPNGIGVDRLLATIERAIGVGDPPHGVAVIVGRWRYERLRSIRRHLLDGEIATAAAAAPALLAPELL
ncbi:tRNA modification GTPase MnmE [Botrimarina colliarenosi]|uniref:tRNA modification GTPase MnmE n=1 Tax=Botrimarina colliarenosi TaxID=2528001 RepID=A0A5C6AL98_9BACT|nr:GTPase [Botrimarina colliarenosi]TWT99801.1 tRNA modification GTPase MnmE [Botrimarina colliarenosi]